MLCCKFNEQHIKRKLQEKGLTYYMHVLLLHVHVNTGSMSLLHVLQNISDSLGSKTEFSPSYTYIALFKFLPCVVDSLGRWSVQVEHGVFI